jgi:hypothetical protein
VEKVTHTYTHTHEHTHIHTHVSSLICLFLLPTRPGLPQYLKDHMVYYAGPAKTPEGYASGSFGPTTAGRMDAYQDAFMAAGGNFISLAKGNR